MNATLLMGIALFVAADQAPYEAVGPNLVANPGFEQAGEDALPAGWGGDAEVYSRDRSVAHGGRASLKFVNPDPDHYVLCTGQAPLETGRMYEVSVWAKSLGVEGSDSGATICVEWKNLQGKYMAGCYPRGVKGDRDWTQITALTPRMPEGATGFTVTCYVRKGMTGTAWWDDVSVRLVREDPLKTTLLVPNYRGEVTDAGPNLARVRAALNLVDYDECVRDVEVRWRVTPAGGRDAVVQGAVEPEGAVLAAEYDLSVPVHDIEPGRYTITIDLVSKRTGKTLAEETEDLVRLAGSPVRKVAFDRRHRTIVDGEPFFPLGMYWTGVFEDELVVFADSAFNCLMPYGMPTEPQMDLAHKHGLKIIYSVKDCYANTRWCPEGIESEADERPFIQARVERFRNHPALLAWYINDELPLGMLPRLTAHRDWLEELDPDHPTWVVLYQVDRVRDYLPTFDVIGTDPYPINRRTPSMAGEWTRETRRAVYSSRPMWQVPQAHNLGIYTKSEEDKGKCRPPTLNEMRSMVWQCIAEGANGIVIYSWFDLRRDPAEPFEQRWADVKAVADEVGKLIPMILSVEPVPDIRIEDTPGLSSMLKYHDGATYLVAVNSLEQPIAARIALPERPRGITDIRTGQPVTPIPEKNFVFRLKPLEVRLLRITGLLR